jgi:hypothetical protein
MSSPYLQVLQVIDDGILAHICPTSYSSVYDDAFDACVVEGDTVFMEVPKDKNFFVDDQKNNFEPKSVFCGRGNICVQQQRWSSTNGQKYYHNCGTRASRKILGRRAWGIKR